MLVFKIFYLILKSVAIYAPLGTIIIKKFLFWNIRALTSALAVGDDR